MCRLVPPGVLSGVTCHEEIVPTTLESTFGALGRRDLGTQERDRCPFVSSFCPLASLPCRRHSERGVRAGGEWKNVSEILGILGTHE